MSVLKTIKGALNNVQQVGSSINKSFKKERIRLPERAGGVNLDAGSDLLNKFQEQWSETHEHTTVNAHAADRIAAVLTNHYERCGKQSETMNQLTSLVSSLPQLLADISCLADRVCEVEKACSELEVDLVELIDVKEMEDVITNKNNHLRQLAMYEGRKNVELEHSKEHLATAHASRMAGYEARLQEHIQDKQKAFEEAFSAEMQHYKEYGNTQMRPLLANATHHVELADIAIEDDTSALDDFLASGEFDSSSANGGAGPLDHCLDDSLQSEDKEDEKETETEELLLVNNKLTEPETDLSISDPLTSGDIEPRGHDLKELPESNETSNKDINQNKQK